ncbi:MAG TPA: tetratricopeptide repeat protein, partial [Beijerinckiaceae bacterium]|nr:tetratricopeptide repeat protein [Beijerinckiaceae bacterium]
MLRPFAIFILLIAGVTHAPAWAQDAADIVVRMNRLENQVRQMSGEIEQLQFENRQLKEQVRKFQEDVEFRFQDQRGAPRAQAPVPTPAPTPASPPRPQRRSEAVEPGEMPAPPGTAARPQRRGDAFDPGEMPNAPGTPRQLGTTAPSAPLTIGGIIDNNDETDPGGPLDLNRVRGGGGAPRSGVSAPAQPPAAPSVAATGSGDARSDFDGAYAYILQKQYERAEMGFRQFLQSHPRDRLVPEATYWLGESYYQRNRHREAAEQFLKVSTEYTSSQRAPDAMLRL